MDILASTVAGNAGVLFLQQQSWCRAHQHTQSAGMDRPRGYDASETIPIPQPAQLAVDPLLPADPDMQSTSWCSRPLRWRLTNTRPVVARQSGQGTRRGGVRGGADPRRNGAVTYTSSATNKSLCMMSVVTTEPNTQSPCQAHMSHRHGQPSRQTCLGALWCFQLCPWEAPTA
jgi:hypothetical protein